MARKKWTPKAEISDALTVFREKRKWQIALRRYVIDQKWAAKYAPYFGVDTVSFRQWIELQFDDECDWGNFSKNWQFDHIVPIAYFNLQEEEDLRLCWSFINIRVEKLESNKNRGNGIDVLSAKAYFEKLFERTGFRACQRMVEKIERIEVSKIVSTEKLERFLQVKEEYLQTIADFSDYEYSRLNDGIPAEQIVEDRQFFIRIRDYN